MTVSRIVTTDEFKQMMSYKVCAENHNQQQSLKLQLLKEVEAVYGERYWSLKEGTRKAIDMLCWFASERGFVFAKDEYLANRYGVSAKTIRNVLKKLREEGVIFTVYRRPSNQNCRTAPVHLFKTHPYFKYWENMLDLRDFQNDFQNETAEKPCESKEEQPKKAPTKYLSFNKNLLKILRKKDRLNSSFTPKVVPDEFVKTAKPFFDDAEDIYDLWKKAALVYRQFDLLHELEQYTELVIDALKQSVYALKHRKIRKDFKGYFYGTLLKMFTYQKRQETFSSHPSIFNWLEDPEEESAGSTKNWRTEIQELMAKEERNLDYLIEELPY
ncbi:helix-turn-helix domain-containing protein [Domibacillus sp. A3M-37]|uniref:helix-turn-helix domain-containing protein n=1 Tax=Domibacillus sp. A3M-37 TaxID=2962037 RepID=UPI0020B6D0D9|nr:helix-turn-helix domain-containing protein [Domibacillus sp. A3M-37]MCP3764897.1 helix-turn-helix domain-containing protein [Domibacillus sp. A3M-37]